MSAIAGVLGLPCQEEIVETMLKTMCHRGPGRTGVYEWKDKTLLHSRFAAANLSTGNSNMVLEHMGERYVLIYDGALYNASQLRMELRALGHQFYGRSDAEVLLHGYVQWKHTLPDKCNGVFALAVLEERSGKLFLARDRMGVKPLFYTHHRGGLLFASEMKTILAYPTMEAILDTEGIGELLLIGPGRTPGSGVFHGISQLEPGHWATYHDGKWESRPYWKLQDREHHQTFAETSRQVRDMVLSAIRQQMVADVPVGTFLSGGLDSSIVSAVCAREMDAQGQLLETFSLDYQDNDRYFQPEAFQPNADTEYIRLMQNHLDTQHHWTVLTPTELIDTMEDAIRARDLPGMADVDSSLLAFCRQICPHVRIALSGECADEIFGGYPWYRNPELRQQEGFPWAQNTAFRASFLHASLKDRLNPDEFVMSRYADTCAKTDVLPGTDLLQRRMKEMMRLNLDWFMQTLLERGDRMGMATGLEIRVPYCDHRIVEYLYGVPWEFKDYRGREKGLLRHAMAGLIPDAVLYRKKSPFPKTYDPAYLETVSHMLLCVMEDPRSPLLQIVDKTALQRLLDAELPIPWYGQLMRRPQTIGYMLQINNWMTMYSVRIHN